MGPDFQSASGSEGQDKFCTAPGHLHVPYRADPTRHGPLPLHSEGPRDGPQQQLGRRLHHGHSWWGWSLTTGYFSPPLRLQFHPIMLKLFHFSHIRPPHAHTLWWLTLQAVHAAGHHPQSMLHGMVAIECAAARW